MAAAASRWEAILAASPHLAPAVALQQHLITLVVNLTETVEHARLPRLSLPPRYLAAKLARGIPAFATEPIPLPVPALTPALLEMCDALANGGAGEPAEHIKAAIVESRMEAGSLLTASFSRDQNAIRTGATHRGLSADLVWLVAELAVSPYAHVLQRVLLTPSPKVTTDPSPASETVLLEALENWSYGYCPACSSWPALAEIRQSHRVLRCSFCAHAWELKSLSCVYCGAGGEKVVIFAGKPERPDQRVEICGGCGGYLKTVDVAELSPFPLLAITDLETMELDMMAIEKGYGRPLLKEFKRR
jgi:FdhE protein